ncbi:coagulase domain-containing protein [Staphylococcus aureus]|nr:coagulase domain-containing protein [Staphylococcus aureus]
MKFDDFDLYRLTKKEYNELHQSLKEAVDEFNSEVKNIQSKQKDLLPYDEATENRVTNGIYDFVCRLTHYTQHILIIANMVIMLKN